MGAIALVAGLTAASGLWVLIDMRATTHQPPSEPAANGLGTPGQPLWNPRIPDPAGAETGGRSVLKLLVLPLAGDSAGEAAQRAHSRAERLDVFREPVE